jgi:hypothetical protein
MRLRILPLLPATSKLCNVFQGENYTSLHQIRHIDSIMLSLKLPNGTARALLRGPLSRLIRPPTSCNRIPLLNKRLPGSSCLQTSLFLSTSSIKAKQSRPTPRRSGQQMQQIQSRGRPPSKNDRLHENWEEKPRFLLTTALFILLFFIWVTLEVVAQIIWFICTEVLRAFGLIGPDNSGRWEVLSTVDMMDKKTVEWLHRYPTEDRGKRVEDDER